MKQDDQGIPGADGIKKRSERFIARCARKSSVEFNLAPESEPFERAMPVPLRFRRPTRRANAARLATVDVTES